MDEIIYSAGSSAARSYPVSLVLSGWYNWGSGAAGEQNGASILWSSTAVESEIARLLAIRATSVQPRGSYYLTAGYSLRCVEISAYGSTSARSYPVSLVCTGDLNYDLGTIRTQENVGKYWSSYTHESNTEWSWALNFFYNNPSYEGLYPRSQNTKTTGEALRLRLHFRA